MMLNIFKEGCNSVAVLGIGSIEEGACPPRKIKLDCQERVTYCTSTLMPPISDDFLILFILSLINAAFYAPNIYLLFGFRIVLVKRYLFLKL